MRRVTVRPIPCGSPPERFKWLADRIPITLSSQFGALEAVDERGRTVAMVGYDGWTTNGVSLHIALEHPAALRHVLGPGFGIPFIELGKQVVVATVLSNNARSMRLVPRLGFREVFRGREWWSPGVDVVFFEMRREECRYVRKALREQERAKKERRAAA